VREGEWKGSSYNVLLWMWNFSPVRLSHFRCFLLKGVTHARPSFSGLVVHVSEVRVRKPLKVVTPQSDNLQLLLLNKNIKDNIKAQRRCGKQRANDS